MSAKRLVFVMALSALLMSIAVRSVAYDVRLRLNRQPEIAGASNASSVATPASPRFVANSLMTLHQMPGAAAPLSLTAAVMTQNFEGSWPAAGWTLYGDNYTWGKRNCHPRTGSFAGWGVGGGGSGSSLSCSDNYPNSVYSWAVYGPFDLSQATSATLRYHFYGRTEGGSGCPFDLFFVGSSINGYNFYGPRYCGDHTGGSAGNGYTSDYLDLGGRLGESQVWVGFAFITDGSVTDMGITIDDISLDAIIPTPVPLFRFRGYTYQGLPGNTTTPQPGVSLRLFGRMEGVEPPGTPQPDVKVSDGAGFWNFTLTNTYDYYRVIAEPPTGMVSAGATSVDGRGTVVAANAIEWFRPTPDIVHANQFFFAVPTSTPTASPTPTATRTPTRTPTRTLAPSFTPTVAVTPTTTPSSTPTPSPTTTLTPTPTLTPLAPQCQYGEPNDSFGAASGPLLNTQPVIAALCNGDPDDFYRVELPANTQVFITLGGSPGNLDADLYLYNAGGFEVGRSTRRGTSQEQITYTPPFEGRYFLQVHPVSGWNSSAYSLVAAWQVEYKHYIPWIAHRPTRTPTVTPTATPTPGPCQRYEPNDNSADAFGPLENGSVINAPLCEGDPDDYYQIALAAPASVQAGLDNLPAGTDYDLYIYDMNAPANYLARSVNPGTTAEHIQIILPAGRYALRVYPSTSGRSAQSYRLTVQWSPAFNFDQRDLLRPDDASEKPTPPSSRPGS